MKFYFAGAESSKKSLLEEGALQHLVSYFSFRKADEIENEDIFLDSGAFTAWSQQKKIDIDAYAEYLNKYKDKFTVYANLDVIGDPEATLKNQEYLESKGVKPLPAIHYGADLKYLTYYAEKYDYIALGGLVPYAKDKILLTNWLNKCFRILMPYIKEKKLKIHGFGVGSAEILKVYPFYSADSTGYLAGGKFGTVVTWDSNSYKMLSGSHYQDKNTFLKRGADLKITGHHTERLKHNIREYLKMEKDITKLWNDRGIKFD